MSSVVGATTTRSSNLDNGPVNIEAKTSGTQIKRQRKPKVQKKNQPTLVISPDIVDATRASTADPTTLVQDIAKPDKRSRATTRKITTVTEDLRAQSKAKTNAKQNLKNFDFKGPANNSNNVNPRKLHTKDSAVTTAKDAASNYAIARDVGGKHASNKAVAGKGGTIKDMNAKDGASRNAGVKKAAATNEAVAVDMSSKKSAPEVDTKQLFTTDAAKDCQTLINQRMVTNVTRTHRVVRHNAEAGVQKAAGKSDSSYLPINDTICGLHNDPTPSIQEPCEVKKMSRSARRRARLASAKALKAMTVDENTVSASTDVNEQLKKLKRSPSKTTETSIEQKLTRCEKEIECKVRGKGNSKSIDQVGACRDKSSLSKLRKVDDNSKHSLKIECDYQEDQLSTTTDTKRKSRIRGRNKTKNIPTSPPQAPRTVDRSNRPSEQINSRPSEYSLASSGIFSVQDDHSTSGRKNKTRAKSHHRCRDSRNHDLNVERDILAEYGKHKSKSQRTQPRRSRREDSCSEKRDSYRSSHKHAKYHDRSGSECYDRSSDVSDHSRYSPPSRSYRHPHQPRNNIYNERSRRRDGRRPSERADESVYRLCHREDRYDHTLRGDHKSTRRDYDDDRISRSKGKRDSNRLDYHSDHYRSTGRGKEREGHRSNYKDHDRYPDDKGERSRRRTKYSDEDESSFDRDDRRRERDCENHRRCKNGRVDDAERTRRSATKKQERSQPASHTAESNKRREKGIESGSDFEVNTRMHPPKKERANVLPNSEINDRRNKCRRYIDDNENTSIGSRHVIYTQQSDRDEPSQALTEDRLKELQAFLDTPERSSARIKNSGQTSSKQIRSPESKSLSRSIPDDTGTVISANAEIENSLADKSPIKNKLQNADVATVIAMCSTHEKLLKMSESIDNRDRTPREQKNDDSVDLRSESSSSEPEPESAISWIENNCTVTKQNVVFDEPSQSQTIINCLRKRSYSVGNNEFVRQKCPIRIVTPIKPRIEKTKTTVEDDSVARYEPPSASPRFGFSVAGSAIKPSQNNKNIYIAENEEYVDQRNYLSDSEVELSCDKTKFVCNLGSISTAQDILPKISFSGFVSSSLANQGVNDTELANLGGGVSNILNLFRLAKKHDLGMNNNETGDGAENASSKPNFIVNNRLENKIKDSKPEDSEVDSQGKQLGFFSMYHGLSREDLMRALKAESSQITERLNRMSAAAAGNMPVLGFLAPDTPSSKRARIYYKGVGAWRYAPIKGAEFLNSTSLFPPTPKKENDQGKSDSTIKKETKGNQNNNDVHNMNEQHSKTENSKEVLDNITGDGITSQASGDSKPHLNVTDGIPKIDSNDLCVFVPGTNVKMRWPPQRANLSKLYSANISTQCGVKIEMGVQSVFKTTSEEHNGHVPTSVVVNKRAQALNQTEIMVNTQRIIQAKFEESVERNQMAGGKNTDAPELEAQITTESEQDIDVPRCFTDELDSYEVLRRGDASLAPLVLEKEDIDDMIETIMNNPIGERADSLGRAVLAHTCVKDEGDTKQYSGVILEAQVANERSLNSHNSEDKEFITPSETPLRNSIRTDMLTYVTPNNEKVDPLKPLVQPHRKTSTTAGRYARRSVCEKEPVSSIDEKNSDSGSYQSPGAKVEDAEAKSAAEERVRQLASGFKPLSVEDSPPLLRKKRMRDALTPSPGGEEIESSSESYEFYEKDGTSLKPVEWIFQPQRNTDPTKPSGFGKAVPVADPRKIEALLKPKSAT